MIPTTQRATSARMTLCRPPPNMSLGTVGILTCLRDLEAAATAGFGNHAPGWRNIPGFALVRMLQHVSTQLPQVTFFARGIGEEFHDLWLVQIRAGEVQEKS